MCRKLRQLGHEGPCAHSSFPSCHARQKVLNCVIFEGLPGREVEELGATPGAVLLPRPSVQCICISTSLISVIPCPRNHLCHRRLRCCMTLAAVEVPEDTRQGQDAEENEKGEEEHAGDGAAVSSGLKTEPPPRIQPLDRAEAEDSNVHAQVERGEALCEISEKVLVHVLRFSEGERSQVSAPAQG